MKAIRIILILIGTWATLLAQGTEKTLEKPDGQHTYHYFAGTIAISTEIFWNRETGKGLATAFNRAGKEIYRQELSIRNLIQSVRFKYYGDGALEWAHYTWHPDAGIQRGGSTTYFDPEGNVTRVVEDVDPTRPLTAPGRPSTKHFLENPSDPTPRVQPQQPPVREVEQPKVIYHTEYFVVNNARKPLIVKLLDPQGHPLPKEQFQHRELQPEDTLRCGEIVTEGQPGDPCDQIQFQVEARKRKWLTGVNLYCKAPRVVESGPTSRKLYYPIRFERMPFY